MHAALQQYFPRLGAILAVIFVVSCRTEPNQASIESLEKQLAEIDGELADLARINFRYGVGNIGWLSGPSKAPENRQWAEIKLPKNTQFESIALVPMLWNDSEKGPVADAFPRAFRILAGKRGDSKGRVIATRGSEDDFLPRVAPLIIDVPATTADWVRVESVLLSKDHRANRNILAFSEIMIFQGQRNVALARPVTTSSEVGGWGAPATGSQTLTDGTTPYLMNAGGKASNSYLAFFNDQKVRPAVTVDLGESFPIDEIYLHNADASEQIPQIHDVDFGIPFDLAVLGANQEDFSDAVPLLNFKRKTIYEVGPILSRNIPRRDCRYIRLSVRRPYQMPAGPYRFSLGLAEIIVISNGVNVALNKSVNSVPTANVRIENQPSLVDGRNHFGEILFVRDWIGELARRHELERQRPRVAQAIQAKYSHQKATLRWMSWLVIGLVVGLVFVILFGRMLRLRAVLRVRERTAANLHDELSANLQALVLLSDMAKNNLTNSEKLANVVDRIHRLSVRNRTHTRVFMQQLQSGPHIEDLESEMKRSADRLLSNLAQDLQLDALADFQNMSQRKKSDLFLFFQECLINIARHADASAVRVQVHSDSHQGQLIVCDDGRGTTKVPPSLARRARFLRAKIQLTSPAEGGTCISLTFPRQKVSRLRLLQTPPNQSHENIKAPAR